MADVARPCPLCGGGEHGATTVVVAWHDEMDTTVTEVVVLPTQEEAS